jgi:hypothetical protein
VRVWVWAEGKTLSEEEEAWRRGKVWRVLMGCRP